MRIAVIGAGGVGGYFGAKLALGGHDVTFVARAGHLEAIRANGLEVRTAAGSLRVAPARAVARIADAGPVDVAMLCVKLWDVEAAAAELGPLLAEGGVAIPFQNGVDSPQILRRVLSDDRVLGGVAYIVATIAAPGVIAQTGSLARLAVGAFAPSCQPQAAAFAAACAAAGIDCEHALDIRLPLWKKFIFLAGVSGATSLARQPLGVVRADSDLRAILAAAMHETAAVARSQGIELQDGFVDEQLAFADTLPGPMRSSLLNDLMAGNRLEAPWLAGGVMRIARACGLAAPVNATIYAALKPYLDGTAAAGARP